jgi:hypothetical protein
MVLVYIGEASNVSEGEESIKITLKKKGSNPRTEEEDIYMFSIVVLLR